MSFLKRYNIQYKTILNFLQTKNQKPEKMKLLIKIFDKPARKSLVLISSLMLINDWSISLISVQKKYKYYVTMNFIKSINNLNL